MNFNPTLLSRRIEAVPARECVAIAAAAILAIGVLDHLTGPVVSLAILYLIPVVATAWIVGPRPAYVLSLEAAMTWAVADRIGPLAEPRAELAYLNDISILLVFAVLVFVIGVLRREVRRQRELLQDAQRHLLPKTLASFEGLDIASRWIPAWTVGGDYYDVIDAGDGRVALCLADVSGKGITAALIMSNVQAIVQGMASDRRHAPDRVLTTLNQLLFQRLRPDFFVTVFLGLVDVRTGELAFASAGHSPAFLLRSNGTVERLESTGPVAGMLPEAAFRRVALRLDAGDRIVIYSDGVTEYENRAGEQFGEKRLLETLAQRATSADATCAGIAESLAIFGKGRPFNDDVTMLVVASQSR